MPTEFSTPSWIFTLFQVLAVHVLSMPLLTTQTFFKIILVPEHGPSPYELQNMDTMCACCGFGHRVHQDISLYFHLQIHNALVGLTLLQIQCESHPCLCSFLFIFLSFMFCFALSVAFCLFSLRLVISWQVIVHKQRKVVGKQQLLS